MSRRRELYNKIAQMGAASAIKAKFGDNYTRISNYDLETFLKGFAKKAKPAKKCESGYKNAIVELLSVLQVKKVLTAKEAEGVAKLL